MNKNLYALIAFIGVMILWPFTALGFVYQMIEVCFIAGKMHAVEFLDYMDEQPKKSADEEMIDHLNEMTTTKK